MTLAEALQAHEFVLTFGGLAGVRDRGSIESAVARPYSGYYRPITKKAAALVQSLAQNHGFADGNKRTAILMLLILLVRSGYTLRFRDKAARNREIEEMILSVVDRTMDFEQLVRWMRVRLKRYEIGDFPNWGSWSPGDPP